MKVEGAALGEFVGGDLGAGCISFFGLVGRAWVGVGLGGILCGSDYGVVDHGLLSVDAGISDR